MNTDLSTDCLLGVVGLIPDVITQRQHIAAAVLPDTFSARARAWWKLNDYEKFKVVNAPKNLDDLFDKIALEPSQQELAAWLEASNDDDDDAITSFHLSLIEARKYLVKKWPRIQIETFGGTRLMPLAVDDAAEVASLWAVLNEPTRILDEMDSASITPSQATAFRTVYPKLYDYYRNELAMGAAEQTAKDPQWMPDESQEILLGILTGQPSGTLNYEATAGEAKAPVPEKDLGASDAETQLDKSSKPRSANK